MMEKECHSIRLITGQFIKMCDPAWKQYPLTVQFHERVMRLCAGNSGRHEGKCRGLTPFRFQGDCEVK